MAVLTQIDWDAMTQAKNILVDQSGRADGEGKKISGLQEEASIAWRGSAGATWNSAVGDWIRNFNIVKQKLDEITTTLQKEIEMHIRHEEDNNSIVGGHHKS